MTAPPVARVYVAACRDDFHLARLCVSSVRYWHPKIPISLICDFGKGDFDPSTLLQDWKIDLFETRDRSFGYGFSKLEPLFLSQHERYVMLDADLVLVGPVIDLLEQNPADFVVSQDSYSQDELEIGYFSMGPLAQFDPTFPAPPFIFNTGQYLATTGLLHRSDFDRVLEWTSPRNPLHPEIFKCGEQGILNYVLFKAAAEKRISLGNGHIYLWSAQDTSTITVAKIKARQSPLQVMHWNGLKSHRVEDMERSDVLEFFHKFDEDRRSWSRRWKDWRAGRPLHRWQLASVSLAARARHWLAGTSLVEGGNAWKFGGAFLSNFYRPEKLHQVVWRWSQPDAGIELRVSPGRYRVKIETGSPHPLHELPQRNICFFLDHVALPSERIAYHESGLSLDLQPTDFSPTRPHLLRWTMDPQPVPATEKRSLGMPIIDLLVHRLPVNQRSKAAL